jgi:UDP-GlcNAc:undecaprenyl-phosphate/decaprenyl-phosphate GlcNAc-1-phosphate transferase
MSRPSNWLYLWIFVAAFAGAFVLTPLAAHFARRFGVVDSPNARKAHIEPVSLLGGMAIYGGTFGAAWTLVAGGRPELKAFFLGGLVILVFGIQDDISGMDPWVKTLGQATAALVLVGFGVQVRLTGVTLLDVVLSVVWVVAVVNAFNYQDNMNGLATGLAALSSLAFFTIAVVTNQYLVAVLSVGLAGGAIGFLPSNFPEARIFMGDAGSLFLGYVLAFLGIRLRFLDRPKSSTFIVPAIVLALPLFDAGLVTLSRARRRLPVTRGGTDHTSHRLTRLGRSPRGAVVTLWFVQACLGGAAFAVARLGRSAEVVVVVACVALGALALVVLERPSVTRSLPMGPVDGS